MEQNYWLHRISYEQELSYPFLENYNNKNYLTIGFSDFSTKEFIDESLKENTKYFDDKFKELWGGLSKNRYSLFNFLYMKKDDIVVVPSYHCFYVCKIIDDRPLLITEAYFPELKNWHNKKIIVENNILKTEDNNKKYGLGFARKIEIIQAKIPREKFADGILLSRLKARQTTLLINDLKASVETAIENFKNNKPINLHSILLETSSNNMLEELKKSLNPNLFEKLIKQYFEGIGADNVEIPAKNERDKEGDADIVAVFEKIKLIIYVQAKKHVNTENAVAVQQIIDYQNYKDQSIEDYNSVAWVISTADSFNEDAIKIAKENNIQLFNGIEFCKMVLNAGLSLIKN